LGLATIPVVLLELRLTPFIARPDVSTAILVHLAVSFFLLAAKLNELWQSLIV
jgi:hypothetical protein